MPKSVPVGYLMWTLFSKKRRGAQFKKKEICLICLHTHFWTKDICNYQEDGGLRISQLAGIVVIVRLETKVGYTLKQILQFLIFIWTESLTTGCSESVILNWYPASFVPCFVKKNLSLWATLFSDILPKCRYRQKLRSSRTLF